MNICVPKERRTFEFRVGLTPSVVQMLSDDGHKCYVEHNAGVGAGFSDQEYEQAGARIVYTPHEVLAERICFAKLHAQPMKSSSGCGLKSLSWVCCTCSLPARKRLT